MTATCADDVPGRDAVLSVLSGYLSDAEDYEQPDGSFRFALVDEDEDEAEEIGLQLPKGWHAAWTGDGNTVHVWYGGDAP